MDFPWQTRVQVLLQAAHGPPLHTGREPVRSGGVQEQGRAAHPCRQPRREPGGGVHSSQPLPSRGFSCVNFLLKTVTVMF